jgi:hypothetical protein
MVHAVQDGVCSRGEIRTPLPDPSKKVEKLFPVFVHHKHLMRCIAVKKKALAEEREIPMQEKEENNNHLDGFLMVNKDR